MDECCVNGSTKVGELQELSEYLRLISDINRLQILCLLKKGERCVCEIYGPLGLSQNLASHHLKALRDAGLVIARREGKWVHYRLDTGRIDRLSRLYYGVFLGGDNGDQGTGAGLRQLQETSCKCS